jgi:hypothetical protein
MGFISKYYSLDWGSFQLLAFQQLSCVPRCCVQLFSLPSWVSSQFGRYAPSNRQGQQQQETGREKETRRAQAGKRIRKFDKRFNFLFFFFLSLSLVHATSPRRIQNEKRSPIQKKERRKISIKRTKIFFCL